MPQSNLNGKSPAGFQRLAGGNQRMPANQGSILLRCPLGLEGSCAKDAVDVSSIGHFEKWHGQQGSNLRPAVLETAALPTELCPYVRVSAQQALPKSFRALCKERSDWIVPFTSCTRIRIGDDQSVRPISTTRLKSPQAGISRPTAADKDLPARPTPRPASVPSPGRRSRQGWSSSWPAAIPIRHRP